VREVRRCDSDDLNVTDRSCLSELIPWELVSKHAFLACYSIITQPRNFSRLNAEDRIALTICDDESHGYSPDESRWNRAGRRLDPTVDHAQTSMGTSQRFLGVAKGRLATSGGPFVSELGLRLIIKLIIPRQKLN
jgi:hypothetical protein